MSKNKKRFTLLITRLKGFTILEMMVTITFAAILATATVPSFFSMYERYLFRRDVFAVYDLILQARNNAMSAKNCHNIQNADGENFSDSWEVRLIRLPFNDPAEYRAQLICNLQGDASSVAEADKIDDEIIFNDIGRGVIREDGFNTFKAIHVFQDEQQAVQGTEEFEVAEQAASVHFFTDSVRAKIHELTLSGGVYEPTDGGSGLLARYDNFRAEFEHKDGDDNHTICINRIAAFPVRYERASDCEDI